MKYSKMEEKSEEKWNCSEKPSHMQSVIYLDTICFSFSAAEFSGKSRDFSMAGGTKNTEERARSMNQSFWARWFSIEELRSSSNKLIE